MHFRLTLDPVVLGTPTEFLRQLSELSGLTLFWTGSGRHPILDGGGQKSPRVNSAI